MFGEDGEGKTASGVDLISIEYLCDDVEVCGGEE
jgi:hypothetical protein